MGGEPLKSIEQWMGWSKEERVKFLKSLRFMFLFGDLIYMGAFSEAKWAPCRGDDIRCSVRFLLGVDADDYAPFHFGWFDASKGAQVKNCFDVIVDRSRMTKRMLASLLASVGCMRDPDPDLKDELASLRDLAASEHTSVHEDHYGGWNCGPADLVEKGLVYMLNEFASYLVPMKAETHKIRTANQQNHPDAERNKLEMIQRDYSKHTEMYSDARRARLSTHYNSV